MRTALHDLHSQRREHVHWFSEALERRMDLLWYGHAGRPMVWIPTFQGRCGDLEAFGLVGAVEPLLEAGLLQLACIDTVDEHALAAEHLPPAERVAMLDRYDRYLADEVVDWVRERSGSMGRVGLLGVSCGAYHAVNFAFRHPDVVDKVVGLSGRYEVTDLLGGDRGPGAYFHTPLAYVANMDDGWVRRLSALDISIVSGEHDYLAGCSRQMIDVLAAKGIPHRGHVWGAPFGHDWAWWQHQITHYVP